MYAAALRVELRIPDTHSLKQKRHKLQTVVNHISTKFSVSVAEVDYQDAWQRATLGVAAVAPQSGQLQRVLRSVERAMEGLAEVEVLEIAVSHLERPE